MRCIEILPNLWTRGKLAKETTLEDIQELGIHAVVSLIPPGEPALVGWEGYTHWPMSDGSVVDVRSLEKIRDVVLDNLKDDRRTLVMCRAGRNRTGLVVASVLRIWLKLSGAEALQMFREKRPRGVANPAFENYLLSLPK